MGDEDRLVDCPGVDFVADCFLNHGVRVTCQKDDPVPPPMEGQLTLISEESATDTVSGLPAVFHNGLWGWVCWDAFSIFDASVICRQLGHSSIGESLAAQ